MTTLYIVPTPIGNLKDITLRAIEILKEVDFIIAEDTRHSRKLLTHLGIHKRLVSYYKHREQEKTVQILKMLKTQNGALVSDSGTPLVSDPGFYLVQRAITAGIKVVGLPGPCAFLPGLVVSGITPDSFVFLGFPPRKKGELVRLLKSLSSMPYTLIFYESAKRVVSFLKNAGEVLANRPFVVVKEISKINETVIRGNLEESDQVLEDELLLGELVVVIGGQSTTVNADPGPEINSLDDLYTYFKDHHRISKNRIKQIIMKKK